MSWTSVCTHVRRCCVLCVFAVAGVAVLFLTQQLAGPDSLMHGVGNVTSASLHAIGTYLPQLRRLNVSGRGGLGVSSVLFVASQCRHLTHVALLHCGLRDDEHPGWRQLAPPRVEFWDSADALWKETRGTCVL